RDQGARAAHRQGRPLRALAADGAADDADRGRRQGGCGHRGRRAARGRRGGAAMTGETSGGPLTGTHRTHWIGGKLWEGAAQRRGDIFNPATGKVSGTVDFASAQVVDDAAAAASKAFEGWRAASVSKRTNVMFAFRQLVKEHADELAEVISAEHGKVAADAAGEVARGQEVVEFACGIGHLLK